MFKEIPNIYSISHFRKKNKIEIKMKYLLWVLIYITYLVRTQ